ETMAGVDFGTLAVVLEPPRELTASQAEGLDRLARQMVALVEQARHSQERRLRGAGRDDTRALDEPRTVRSEYRLRHLVDDVDDVLFEQDPQGRWTFLNAAWTSVLGYETEACIGHHYLDY